MSRVILCILLLLTVLPAPAVFAAEAVPIIFDTDMGNDIDDALALAVLHSLESRGECRLIAVTITKDNRWAAPYVDLVNTFYKRAYIPVGVVKGSGITPDTSNMIRLPVERKRPDGTPVYPHRLSSGKDAPDAVGVLRRALANEKDGSVVIVQVGFSTNLAHLLDTPPDAASSLSGQDLVAHKVKMLTMMAGNFEARKPEFNIEKDIHSAQHLFSKWPTPIVTSGWEIGNSMLFPASRIERDFSYVKDHPIAEAYRDYKQMPYDRPTWDVTAALYAVRPKEHYFSLSARGTITVDDSGRTAFHADPNGRHQYLTIEPAERARTLEAMILLSSEPPNR